MVPVSPTYPAPASAQPLNGSNRKRNIAGGNLEDETALLQQQRTWLESRIVTLGGYEIDRANCLSVGMHYLTYQGWSVETSDPVEIKMAKIANVTSFQRMNAEIAIANELAESNTPHRLPLCEVMTAPGTLQTMMVTDLVAGKSLRDVYLKPVSPMRIPLGDIVSIAKQTLRYLASLDRLKIIHGDLNPTKMIYENGYLQIDDLGCAFREGSIPLLDKPAALPYQSPEQILKHPNITPSSNLWSLGCILYELFTNTVLFPFKKQESFEMQVHNIVRQIGLPSQQFLAESRAKPACRFPSTTYEWIHTLHKLGTRRGGPPVKIEQLIQLIMAMLQYENRPSPEELLQLPLFGEDICIWLESPLPSYVKLQIFRDVDVAKDPQAKPVFVLDPQLLPDCTCLQFLKDPSNHYKLTFWNHAPVDLFIDNRQVVHYQFLLVCIESGEKALPSKAVYRYLATEP